jgi:hypothetical protein
MALMTPAQKRRQQLAAMAEKKQAADHRRRRSRLAFSDSGDEDDSEEEERPLDDRDWERKSFIVAFDEGCGSGSALLMEAGFKSVFIS